MVIKYCYYRYTNRPRIVRFLALPPPPARMAVWAADGRPRPLCRPLNDGGSHMKACGRHRRRRAVDRADRGNRNGHDGAGRPVSTWAIQPRHGASGASSTPGRPCESSDRTSVPSPDMLGVICARCVAALGHTADARADLTVSAESRRRRLYRVAAISRGNVP